MAVGWAEIASTCRTSNSAYTIGYEDDITALDLSEVEAEYNAAVSVISMMMHFMNLYSLFGFDIKCTLYLDSADGHAETRG
eukprot:5020138-Amphidinium_carterae.2